MSERRKRTGDDLARWQRELVDRMTAELVACWRSLAPSPDSRGKRRVDVDVTRAAKAQPAVPQPMVESSKHVAPTALPLDDRIVKRVFAAISRVPRPGYRRFTQLSAREIAVGDVVFASGDAHGPVGQRLTVRAVSYDARNASIWIEHGCPRVPSPHRFDVAHRSGVLAVAADGHVPS